MSSLRSGRIDKRKGPYMQITIGFLDENDNWVPVSEDNPLPTE